MENQIKELEELIKVHTESIQRNKERYENYSEELHKCKTSETLNACTKAMIIALKNIDTSQFIISESYDIIDNLKLHLEVQ